jgi:hypothetical protein
VARAAPRKANGAAKKTAASKTASRRATTGKPAAKVARRPRAAAVT